MSRRTVISNRPPLGTIIASRLNQLDCSQKWLSEVTGISQVYLCNILAGKANPTIKLLRKIAKSLDINVKDLTDALLEQG